MFDEEFGRKTLLSTGAASGMGLLICEEFLKYGGNAIMADIDGEALRGQADRLNDRYPGRALAIACDVREYAQVCRVRDEGVKAFGSIDVLANFAGGAETRVCGVGGDFCDVPIEAYDWGIDVNLRAQLYFDHAVFSQMRRQGSGVIVNIGSVTGEEGDPCAVAYAASKSGAMRGLTKSVALAGAKYGIRCVGVAPGPVMTRPGMAAMKTLIGRGADPIEIVNIVLFLASSHADSVTGTYILADGGRSVMRDKEHGDYGKYGK